MVTGSESLLHKQALYTPQCGMTPNRDPKSDVIWYSVGRMLQCIVTHEQSKFWPTIYVDCNSVCATWSSVMMHWFACLFCCWPLFNWRQQSTGLKSETVKRQSISDAVFCFKATEVWEWLNAKMSSFFYVLRKTITITENFFFYCFDFPALDQYIFIEPVLALGGACY